MIGNERQLRRHRGEHYAQGFITTETGFQLDIGPTGLSERTLLDFDISQIPGQRLSLRETREGTIVISPPSIWELQIVTDVTPCVNLDSRISRRLKGELTYQTERLKRKLTLLEGAVREI